MFWQVPTHSQLGKLQSCTNEEIGNNSKGIKEFLKIFLTAQGGNPGVGLLRRGEKLSCSIRRAKEKLFGGN